MSAAAQPTAAGYAASQIADGSYLIPDHMRGGIERYVLHGVPMGHFGTALLSNDFMGAANRADSENLACLGQWAQFLYNYVPNGCKGSPERVSEWIASGGVVGQAEQVPA